MSYIVKKLLIVLSMVWSTSWAQTVVPIVWPFNIGSSQAAHLRAIIDDANAQQQKYQFVFEHKQGAGGSIGMNHTLNSRRLIMVGNGSSTFTRPLFFPNASFDVTRFVPVITQYTGSPLAVSSKKYSSMAELKRQSRLSIGVNNGSVIQLVAELLAKQLPGVDIVFVPFNGSQDMTFSMLGGNLDLSIDFAANIQQWTGDNKLSVIGITGKKSRPGFPTFASQGFHGFENVVQDFFLLTTVDTPEPIRKELHAIFYKANQSPRVLALYRQDFAIPANHTLSQSEEFYQSRYIHWRRLVVK